MNQSRDAKRVWTVPFDIGEPFLVVANVLPGCRVLLDALANAIPHLLPRRKRGAIIRSFRTGSLLAFGFPRTYAVKEIPVALRLSFAAIRNRQQVDAYRAG